VKVLIVDDSASMRMIVKRTLRQAGFSGLTISEAGDGAEALAAIAKDVPELVLSDWNMPQMSGLELLQKLREGKVPVKFGFVTTEGSAEMRALARENGAQFLIAKPFTAESFERALRPVIG
jgi:two-component system, chemotaxis family, chemotaxis protein CheY